LGQCRFRHADADGFRQRYRFGPIKGIIACDRKQYGMNSGIPFIKIADRVEVDIALAGKRVSGPPLVLKQ
jgi:hypothetical protein